MKYLSLLIISLRYFVRCLPVVLGLSLIAAAGRAIQLGALDQPVGILYWLVEVLVESSRVLVVIALIGGGNIVQGVKKVTHLDLGVAFFQQKPDLKLTDNMKLLTTAVSGIAFGALMFGGNAVLAQIAEEARQSDPEPVLFFLKNVTVIPLAIVFSLAVINFWFFTSGRSGKGNTHAG